MAPMEYSRPHYLAVGRVMGPWGVRGKVKVEILTDFPQRFIDMRVAYLQGKPYIIEEVELHRKAALIKFEGCDDRRLAERLRGKMVEVPLEEAVPLPEGEYYLYQIVGLAVWTTKGEYLGRVREVLFTGSNEVYVVENKAEEILLPAIEDVVKEVDLEGGKLLVELMEGLV